MKMFKMAVDEVVDHHHHHHHHHHHNHLVREQEERLRKVIEDNLEKARSSSLT